MENCNLTISRDMAAEMDRIRPLTDMNSDEEIILAGLKLLRHKLEPKNDERLGPKLAKMKVGDIHKYIPPHDEDPYKTARKVGNAVEYRKRKYGEYYTVTARADCWTIYKRHAKPVNVGEII